MSFLTEMKERVEWFRTWSDAVNVAAVADHYGWAAIVTVDPDGVVVDRRRTELIDAALPSSPFEHDTQDLRIDAAVALVREVELSVGAHVRELWDTLSAVHGITSVAIREIPTLPPSIEERIGSYHARTRADSAMYRQILADDATARGWAVHFYDHRRVTDEATGTLGLSSDHLTAPRRDLGPPWTVDHQRAYAAALLVHHDIRETSS